ncbi:MAG: aldo/keto reductase [Bacteroidales bacterium]|nr:aldo/keto reductase [Bacteroidales bacterium]MBQ1857752.1 aldo/keto reductase [Bacteroidales bacterium]MEE3407423.1 aldo/keto reductase [Candidatus Cryptobacteroides sp.]
MDRREFLKRAGAGAVALGAAACTGGISGRKTAVQGTSGEMVYRTNPANGDRVSLLGYGCMRWPMIKDENGRDIIDQEKVDELIDVAMKNGVNYYDTSPAYLQGQSERATGKALARYPRKSFYIATKLSNFGDASHEASLKMYRDSFEEMQTDYFDYYLMHAIGRGGYEAFKQRYEDNGMMDFLLKERESGRIRQLGFSFHGRKSEFDELLALHDKYHWDFVQIEMNYMDWKHADGVRNVNADYLYEQLDKREIPITIMEPLLGGRLSSLPENIAAKLKERDPDASLASWAFRFVGSYPRILTVLSGMTYMEHLQDNLKTFMDFKPMDEEELAFMEEMATLMAEYPTVNCTHCNYCMPCPYGIDIPGIFAHYNKCVNEGTVAQSEEQKNFRKLRKAYLTSYNKAIPTLRQADHCIGCGQCMEHCPQSIKIPDQLHRIDAYIETLKRSM